LSKIDEKTKKPHLWGWNFNIHLFMLLVSFDQMLHTLLMVLFLIFNSSRSIREMIFDLSCRGARFFSNSSTKKTSF